MSKLILAAAGLLVVVSPAVAQDASEIVKKADLFRRPADSYVWSVTITTHERDKAPMVNGYEVYVKGSKRVFIQFVSPTREVGRSLLGLDRDLWIYLPDAGKPLRIPLSQRLVGQVANGDMARTDYAGDYTPTLAGTDVVDGRPCYVLDLKAATKDVTYAAIKYWVAQDGYRPVKAEFYAGTGTLLKTGTFDGFQRSNGKALATRLTLVDAIRPDKKSIIEFSNVRVRQLPNKYFDKNYMKSLD